MPSTLIPVFYRNRFRLCLPIIAGACLATLRDRPAAAQDAGPSVASVVGADNITLDRIMADPDWLGREPRAGYWADNGESIYYRRKRAGSQRSDWFETDLRGNLLRVVEDKDRGSIDVAEGAVDRERTRKVFTSSNGDLFVKDLQNGNVRQLTRTTQTERSPRFMADGKRIMFRRGDDILARNLNTGLEQELVDLRFEDDPAEKREKDREGYLPEQQSRLFEIVQTEQQDQDQTREANEAEQAADPTRAPLPWYMGDSHRAGNVQLSPNGRWCLISSTAKENSAGQSDKMPEFVDESGYVRVRDVRSLVGTEKTVSDKLILLDLVNRVKHELDFADLPEFEVDRLKEIREKEDFKRIAQVGPIVWNVLGNRVAVEITSADNKDRWIAVVDLKEKKLKTVMHRHDPAWINGRFGEIDWLGDNESLFYLTEQTGYAQLYVTHVPSMSNRQLTRGDFVVSDVQAGGGGEYLYYKANAEHPGIYEIFRVKISDGQSEQLTELGGMNDYVVSPDETQLLITHSTAISPPELWVQPISQSTGESIGDPTAVQITRTVSAEFTDLPWIEPQFVTVPSRAGRPIHARLYLPPGHKPSESYPAVIFIHGAGYLQNAHQGWSGYFREFMFHSLLAHRGYVVLDMDYRASAGYGRDWRTAIYRQMGTPEVEDLADGREWLAEQHGVDRDRVGLYGGSYGGFLTMMALFKEPGKYACGAALRPVTDWAHYNHGYTSNILNTPADDPEAYAKSSPIEFAAGLEDSLLICHGMVDDNVFFKDTARLAQRLIELRKKDWEVAIYPVEPHGFVQPSSWYDEYRRILELFEGELSLQALSQ